MNRTAALIALLLLAPSLSAQQLAAPRFEAAMPAAATPSGAAPIEAAPVAPPILDHAARSQASPAAAAAERDGFSLRPVLHAVGGALVGGWVGYVGAQVVKSDWDKANNGTFAGQRAAWVAAGAAVGVLGAWLIGETGSPGPGPLAVDRPSPRDRSVITAAEIEAAGVENALDVVMALRRDWLQTRGTNSWDESARGTASGFGDSFQASVTPGRDKIVVYLDDIRLGGVDEMADIPAGNLTSIRFLDGRRATFAYGSGHAHGAIVLSTEVPAP